MIISDWWQQVYPYAVELEKNITTSPSDVSSDDANKIIETLPSLLHEIETLSYSEDVELMRDYLIKSVTYLIHAYKERQNGNDNEVEFYYSSALTQVAQLHYYLVQHGFAT